MRPVQNVSEAGLTEGLEAGTSIHWLLHLTGEDFPKNVHSTVLVDQTACVWAEQVGLCIVRPWAEQKDVQIEVECSEMV